jgi:hypothetical protein
VGIRKGRSRLVRINLKLVARQDCTLLAPHPVKISKLEAYRRCFTPLERSGKKKSDSPLRIGRIGRTDSDRQDRPGQTEQAKTDSDRQDKTG